MNVWLLTEPLLGKKLVYQVEPRHFSNLCSEVWAWKYNLWMIKWLSERQNVLEKKKTLMKKVKVISLFIIVTSSEKLWLGLVDNVLKVKLRHLSSFSLHTMMLIISSSLYVCMSYSLKSEFLANSSKCFLNSQFILLVF